MAREPIRLRFYVIYVLRLRVAPLLPFTPLYTSFTAFTALNGQNRLFKVPKSVVAPFHTVITPLHRLHRYTVFTLSAQFYIILFRKWSKGLKTPVTAAPGEIGE